MGQEIGFEPIALTMSRLYVSILVRAALRERDDVVERPLAWIELLFADPALTLGSSEYGPTIDPFNENAESQCSAFSAS